MTNVFLFRGISLPILPQISHENEKGHPSRNVKKHTTVLNKHNRTIFEFKCWLDCQLASFEALLSYEKKKSSTIQRHLGARSIFCVWSYKNDISQNCASSYVPPYHTGKKYFVVTERCIFGTEKKRPQRTSQLNDFFQALEQLLKRRLRRSFATSSRNKLPIRRQHHPSRFLSKSEGSGTENKQVRTARSVHKTPQNKIARSQGTTLATSSISFKI